MNDSDKKQVLLNRWKEAIRAAGFYAVRNCSLCRNEIGFFIVETTIMFDPGCGCANFHNYSPVDTDFYLDPNNGHIPYIEKFIELVLGDAK